MSNSFGYYQFFDVLTQQNISVSPSSKRHTCTTNAFFLSGGVNVPVTDAGLQPIVGGTIALEYYFSVGGG